MENTDKPYLRYTPGENYPFIHCKFQRRHVLSSGEELWGHPSQLSLYAPWNKDHRLLNLQIVMLKCMFHHKVAWDQDPEGEKKYDGFVFFEAPVSFNPPSRRWFNQYPSASYGQLSTDADYHLYLDWKGCGMSVKETIALEDSDKGMTELQDGCKFLANIRRGMVTIAKSPDWKDEDKTEAVSALIEFENRVHLLMEEAVGKKLRIMQVMYEPAADGREPILMDWFEVVFEGDPEYLHTKWEDGRGQRRLVTPVETQL
jgi:hypothetical protein